MKWFNFNVIVHNFVIQGQNILGHCLQLSKKIIFYKTAKTIC